ncbi:MAG: elongation factor G [Sphaerochaeta sp.]|jgi:elongation factor G|nr:elongation factor G [Sphaerochaeta sp.]MCH3919000.1 elongation factor G [Sphaerochaeta sp.]MCI2044922.1 elongation factor G [Sphaerochaeta sp.]MCI2075771.1 elongation factor G [Sphaerochaeta sp.]MCI2096456.1 elongation factor G [Sphaerochaeta sp.]
MVDLQHMRNIGISAHIDSGKTTLSERILYYCNKIHAIHDVHGKDGVGATMDFMDLERERGITIQSAATNVQWKSDEINIIDTPGHVDFTIEVERALRVLDGAILVLDSVAGVQSQSITVDRQMKRYHVPRLAFVNKCDRAGANPYRVKQHLIEKLGLNAVLMQIPIGLEDKLEGVVDLVEMKAYYFDSGADGIHARAAEIPAELVDEAQKKREEMLDGVSLCSDELMEAMLEEKVTPEIIKKAVRKATIALQLCPVFMGSAYKNKGIEPLLDAVVDYLPDPTQVTNKALDLDNHEQEVILKADEDMPPVALAFKLEDGQYGQLTYIRVYQGKIKKGDELYNSRAKRKFRIGRLIKMHADKMEDLDEAGCGEIAALFGIECASGDTFCDPKLNYSMTSMYVPDPVIELAITPVDKKSGDNMGKALNRFLKEDPTFHSYVDPESGQTIIAGMGELHLDVYIERMKREYNAIVTTGQPQVAYREAITQRAEFNYTHKKQTGGSGQYARVAGYMEPIPDPAEGEERKDYEFVDEIKGGAIPNEYIPSCDKGFQKAMEKGTQIGFPIMGVRCVINDGAWHPVDSSDIAFQTAAIGAFREGYEKAKPCIMEPIMKVEMTAPTEYQGNMFAAINQRRGVIISSTEDHNMSTVDAEVPLAEMFGFSTVLRSLTQGKGEFTMELAKYGKVPVSVAEELKKKFQDEKKAAQKQK